MPTFSSAKTLLWGPGGWGPTYRTANTVTVLSRIGEELSQRYQKSMPQSLLVCRAPALELIFASFLQSFLNFFGWWWWWCSQTALRDSLDRSGLSSHKRKQEQNILQMISRCSQTPASLLLDSSFRSLPYTSFVPSPAFIPTFETSSG